MVTDKTRRSTFIEQNLGLVHSCAGRFRGRGIEYDDLYSAGCMGLVKAYDGFDESRGVCFSTYAVPVILGEIKKLFRDGGTVKVSRSLKELSLRINAAREHHSKLCGAEPTLSQLAEELGESVENITLAIQAAQPAVSLTPENREESDRQMDIPVESPEEELADKIGLAEVLKSLPEEDRLIIQLRFLWGQDPERYGKTAPYHAGTDLPAGAQDIKGDAGQAVGRMMDRAAKSERKNWAKGRTAK